MSPSTQNDNSSQRLMKTNGNLKQMFLMKSRDNARREQMTELPPIENNRARGVAVEQILTLNSSMSEGQLSPVAVGSQR